MQNTTQALQKAGLQPAKPKALAIMASRLSVEPEKMLDTLKATVFKNATNEELLALVVVSNEYGLNPFLKEIYAFPAKGGGIVPVVSVDGWNKMLLRQDAFDGIDFQFQESTEDATEPPVSCTATIYLKNRSHPVKITEFYTECYRETEPWKKMPRRMLRNRTLCQAARVAFGFSGIYEDDEAIDIRAEVIEEPPRKVRSLSSPRADERKPEPRNIRAEFQAFLDENEVAFNLFKIWADETGSVEGIDACASLDEVKEADLERLLGGKTNLKTGLLKAKELATR